jgi:hypothetical protein
MMPRQVEVGPSLPTRAQMIERHQPIQSRSAYGLLSRLANGEAP